jgi:ABC-2 type transport system permease protein
MFRNEKGDGANLPERPGGCFAQISPVPFFVADFVNMTLRRDRGTVVNRGLLLKAARETLVMTGLFGLGVAVFEGLCAYIYPTLFPDFAGSLFQLEWIRRMIAGLLGEELGGAIGPQALAALGWIHPLLMALFWGHEIVYWTRVPAGEIDQGTIDLLLSLPVRRIELFLSESAVWLIGGLCLVMLSLAGYLVGACFVAPEDRTRIGQLVIVVANLFCLYVAVGGLACFISALSDRRGRAIGTAFAFALAFLVLQFVAQFWEPAKTIRFLSPLNYYRPMEILRNETWPIWDMLVLAAAGAILWLAAMIRLVRRDLRTS